MFWVFDCGKGENPTDLCHGFDLKDAGHHRIVGKVTLKEGLIHRHIFDPSDAGIVHVHDAIHKQKRIPVRQHRGDVVDVHQCWAVGSEIGQRFRVVDGFDQHFGQCDVGCVPRPCGQHVAVNVPPCEGQISHDVQELVACRFIGVT